ncbi:23S rRNA (pseudouridine(1915)-N(3))-methyltransferase RlmH [Sphaerothrix gracilis]|uniref:23S rRNA (pseudouridine(1915)-N(3))-methyltransferase RlmH n=1 Tax=Sphaerothrix gracilis TaxID=3151835 RepID=UPI0031FC5E8E
MGKVKKGWLRDGLAVYYQRLPELETIEIKDSNPEKEGTQILSMLKSSDRLIALSEEGKTFSSLKLANFLAKANSNSLVFIIGGATGLSQALKQSATQLLSLSPMTFPHEIARLLLVEQLYRAKTILQGSQYHK